MDKCLVYGCPNSVSESDSSIQFYYFPKEPEIAQQWLDSCSVWEQEIDLNSAKICSIHFDEHSYSSEYKMIDVGYERVLKYDALPTLYLPQQTIVYHVANMDDPDNPPVLDYETAGAIIEAVRKKQLQQLEPSDNPMEAIGTAGVIIQQVPNDQLEPVDHPVETIELQPIPIKTESDNSNESEEIDEKYKDVTSFRHLELIKGKSDKMRKELVKLERNVLTLRSTLKRKAEECQKRKVEYQKLSRALSNLQASSISLTDQRSLLSKVFSESQIKILSGKQKIYWSHDDMAVAYTIRQMSSKRCYSYLTKKLNYPLPGLSSIRRWQSTKNDLMGEEMKEKYNEDD